jgi:hypothetical protein
MRSRPSGVGACAWQVGHVGAVPLALPQHTDRTGSCDWGNIRIQGQTTRLRLMSGCNNAIPCMPGPASTTGAPCLESQGAGPPILPRVDSCGNACNPHASPNAEAMKKPEAAHPVGVGVLGDVQELQDVVE